MENMDFLPPTNCPFICNADYKTENSIMHFGKLTSNLKNNGQIISNGGKPVHAIIHDLLQCVWLTYYSSRYLT